ncbi:helix-turn-helix domain-containing protein [Thomasclavelia ramosa]|uniref:helix-turn-helix domain-containing protein n=1 Tax=Thomasclavelia ramosa TaxID=1547 RepID=UPI003DA40457
MYYDVKETGLRIKNIREIHGYSQEEFSARLNISRNYLSKIEIGLKYPSIDLLVEISLFGEVSMDYLILGKTQNRDIKEMVRTMIEKLQMFEKEL